MIQLNIALLTFALVACANSALAAGPSKDKNFPNNDTLEASIYRGKIVFENYCILCHGVKADGNGRAAKLYQPRPANLITSDKNAQYKELIIRQGGAAIGRSEFMPPWNNELTNEQVKDVVSFLTSISAK